MADRVGQQLGHYRLLRLLGQGAFAEVYLGEHQYLERLAAIKVLHVQMKEDTQEPFRREARTIAHLQHPHIVQVLDFGFDEQIPYLVMEYTSGGTLREQHPKGTRLPFEQIVTYVNQLASALDYAHEQRVIHRDIKPENLLLKARGEVVLSDFGLAVVHRTLESLSSHEPAGTPRYMAPEQIEGKPCPASDQYAVGVMVYEWLTGEPPFRGPGMAVFAQHVHDPPPSLCARLPELPPAVEETVLRALAKDPQRRFSTVHDFATALEKAFGSPQPLSLASFGESNKAQDEITPPQAHVRLPRTPFPGDHDQSDADTHPRLQMLPQHEEQQVQALPVSPRTAPPLPVISPPRAPVSLLCLCASADMVYLKQWETHLRPLEQEGYLTVWSERQLLAGAPHGQEINDHLERADLVVLLLSADFFASDDCITLMKKALLRHQRGEARLIPLLLRPCAWRESELASFACLPSDQQAVTTWMNQDAAFADCVRQIRRLLGRPITSTLRQPHAPASALEYKNRQGLLKRVRSSWISGVLDHSLQGAALLSLGLEEHYDAVIHHPETSPRPLPTGKQITQVYDEADGQLLILGAPGAGKTTLLLELARNLLDRAELDEQQQMPVVFTLSSWAAKQQPLAEWMIEELIDKYGVSRTLARTWVETDQILPLLDGLDEVETASRTRCIRAINAYHQEHTFLPLVVSSRSADYLTQTAHIKFTSAVIIQPLTQRQVEEYLVQAGEPLQALRVAFRQDAALRELAETPLMLNILTLTYHGMPTEELLRGGMAPTRQQVFERYVERMLSRKGDTKRYPPSSTITRLKWLAQQMREHNQTIFFLERLQLDWLPPRRRAFYRWSVGLLYGLVFGVGFGLVYGLSGGLVYGLSGGLVYGLGSGLLVGLGGGLSMKTEPVEVVAWSRKSLRSALLVGLLLGLLLGPLVGLFVGLGIGLVFGLVFGFSRKQLIERSMLSPNEGIRRSIKNGLVFGLVVGLAMGLAVGLFSGLAFRVFGVGPGFALLIGLFVGLLFGLDAAIQHYLLRFWLWNTGLFPWKVVRFLDHATARILLRRVGGGYSFVHRLLLEYFASLDTIAMPDGAKVKKE
jgi:serine/threonine protein kinase